MSAPPLRLVVARYGAGIVGGAEALTRSLAERLVARGDTVEVITSRALDEATWADALPGGVTTEAGVRVVRLPVVRPRRPRLFHQASRVMWRLPAAARPERAYVALAGPRLRGLEAALRAPTVATLFVSAIYHPFIHGAAAAAPPRLLLPTAHDEPALRLHRVGRAVAGCGGLWYATPEEQALLERVHPAARAIPSAVGNAGVEAPADLDPERFRARHHVVGPYVVYAGRATAGKGLASLTAAVTALRARGTAVSLVLAGEAGTVTPPAPGILPVGRLDAGALWDALAGAAAVVVPSRHESLSLLALEAWAAGRPVVVDGESAVLAGQAARSGGALAYRGQADLEASLRRLLAEPELGDRLGGAGRRYVAATYRWDEVLARLDGLLDAARRRQRS